MTTKATQHVTTHFHRRRVTTTASASARRTASSRPPAYTYVIAPRASATGIAVHGCPAIQPACPLDAEEREHEEQRLHGDLECDPSELEEPRRRAGEDDGCDSNGRTRRTPVREPPEQEDRREHAHGCESARHLAVRSGDHEHTCEAVDEERALVVEERREVEREASPVLVASLGRDGVGVVRDGRLVAKEAGRVVRRDPELKGGDGENDAEADEERPARHSVARMRR